MNQIDIRIIKKYILNKLTENEHKEFQLWYNSNPKHKEYVENYKSQLNITFETVNQNEINQEWTKLNKTILKKRRIIFLKYAASIVTVFGLLGTLSYTLLFKEKDKSEINKNIAQTTHIKRKESKPILILSDGTKQILSNKDLKLSENGINITKQKNTINYTQNNKSKNTSKQIQYNSIYIPRGGYYRVILSDGTQVYLNSDTKIKYPVQFIGKTREVSIQGEAFFKVTKNKHQPFIVKTSNQSIKVLGTEFNISAYKDDNFTNTTLVEGKVALQYKDVKKKNIVLKPGENAFFNKQNKKLEINNVNTYNYTAWIKGRFVFERESLDNIMTKLSRWYDVKVFYFDDKAKTYNFSMDIKKENSIHQILNLLEKASDLKFKIKDKTLLITKKKK